MESTVGQEQHRTCEGGGKESDAGNALVSSCLPPFHGQGAPPTGTSKAFLLLYMDMGCIKCNMAFERVEPKIHIIIGRVA